MEPKQLSRELRNADGRLMRNRRAVVGLSFLSAECMQLVALYQMGVIKHLPDPPWPGMNSEQVDASEEAYEKFSMPDAFIGLASYSVTAALAAAGGWKRDRTHPWLPLAMGAKTVFDALQAGKLTWDQWSKHRAFCIWCLIAAGSTFVTVPLALPETVSGLKNLAGRWFGRSRTVSDA